MNDPRPTVSIHYRRLPDRVEVFDQLVIERTPTHFVTLMERASVPARVVVGDRVILEPAAPVVWFTYPGRWYDVGLFHCRDGTFTGWYANILTPVVIDGNRWDTTDLCLDVWTDVDGRVNVLDEDDFATAVERRWMDEKTAARARAQAAELADAARRRLWPPLEVRGWTLERALAVANAPS